MIVDYYSYILDEDDDDIISYYFITSNGSVYYVYFDPYQYVEHVHDYPTLLKSGYAFGFHRASMTNGWVSDPLVGETISKIIFDFIEEYTSDVVLLYHCRYDDKKQRGRDKIFQEWYDKSTIKKLIIKKRVEVEKEDKVGNKEKIFMGYLTSVRNENAETVDTEFCSFAETLMVGKP